MNKLALQDTLDFCMEQLLKAAERMDADAVEYRARVLVALAQGVQAYYSATLSLSPVADVATGACSDFSRPTITPNTCTCPRGEFDFLSPRAGLSEEVPDETL